MANVLDAARTGLKEHEVKATFEDYQRLHDEQGGGTREARQGRYDTMVNQYYDMVTDFYEYGWGESFHFAARRRMESFRDSILRHEHYLAMGLGLEPGMRALDVGCGVGGPARNIARISGASVLGLNNNAYQVQRGQQHTQKAGMEGMVDFVEADFMDMPLADETFDAAYAVESTCHAPDRAVAFGEVSRVLKPGALFAGYEWCLTDLYDAGNPDHQAIKKGIEEGNALPDTTHTREVDEALVAAGFEIIKTRDLALDCDGETPWYLPLSGRERTLTGFTRTRAGRLLTHNMVRVLERVRLAPSGCTEIHSLLNATADWLVAGGEEGIFTPMYFFLARNAE